MKCPKCAETSPEDQGEIVMKKNQKKAECFTAVPDTPNATTPLEKPLGKKYGNGSVTIESQNNIVRDAFRSAASEKSKFSAENYASRANDVVL